MALPKIGLQAVLEMAGFDKGLKEYNAGVKGMTQQSEEAATGMERGMGAVGSAIGMAAVAAGAAVGAFYALKKAMELGREGAVILQTAQSFDFLMEKVGASSDILDQLRAASGNTIDDMTLMKATTTLLAGAQGELANKMAETSPQLLEIAKAANKLNPALGDTAFLYESIATGIKRASPMILDNLGLVIKIGDANQAYADAMGITVEAMSAEDKQMALLNATLDAGQVMIDQVGGTTESATDSFDRLKVALKNASDEAKTKLVPTLADVADALTDVINHTLLLNSNLQITERLARTSTDNYKDYALAVIDGAVALGQMNEKGAEQARALINEGKSLHDVSGATNRYTEYLTKLVDKLGLVTEAEYDLIQAQLEDDAQRKDAINRLNIFENVTATAGAAVKDMTELTDDQKKALAELEKQLEATRKKYEAVYSTLAKGIVSIRDANQSIADAKKAGGKALGDIGKDLGQTVDDIKEKYDKMLPDPTSVADRAQMTEDVWDEHFLRMGALLDGVQGEREQYWLEQTRQWTEGTEFMQREGESQEVWLERVRAAYYDNRLPPDFYNTQTAQYQAFVAEKKSLGDEEIAEANRVAAEEKRIAKEKADAAIAEAKRVRNETVVLTALQTAESLGLLQKWATDTQGALAPARDSAAEVMNELKAGTLTLDGPLGELVTMISSGLLGSLKDTEVQAGNVETAFANVFTTARADAKGLLGDWTNLQTAMDTGAEDMGGYFTTMQTAPEPQSFFDYVLDSHGLLVTALQEGSLSGAVTTESSLMQTDLQAVGTEGVTAFTKIQTAITTTTNLLNSQLKTALGNVKTAVKELSEEAWKQFVSNDHSMKNAIEAVRSEANKLRDVLREIKRLIIWINANGVPGVGGGGGAALPTLPTDPGLFQPGPGVIFPEMAPTINAPAMTATATATPGATVVIGDVTITNGMDLAMFEARVQQAVSQGIRGV